MCHQRVDSTDTCTSPAYAGLVLFGVLSTQERRAFSDVAHNAEMKYASILGWGIVIYAVMYLAWSACLLYGFTSGYTPRVLALLVLIVTVTIAARSLRFSTRKDILVHSIGWAIVVGLLDAVFSVPYAGWQLYSDWNVWVGYALVALVPLLAPYTKIPHRFEVT